jgi:hypothetical protein
MSRIVEMYCAERAAAVAVHGPERDLIPVDAVDGCGGKAS